MSIRPEGMQGARLAAIVAGCCLLLSPCAALADEITTTVLDVHQGSQLSQSVQDLEFGGYQLAHGQWQSFYDWYRTDWIDTRVDMVTQTSKDFGVLWGASTGERGEKFMISPGLKLGFISQAHPSPDSTVSFSLTSVLGGQLTEWPCTADYGDIGGVQQVNCRYAAAPIPPADTLPLLLRLNPERLKVVASYQGNF